MRWGRLAALQGKTIKQYTLERLFPGDTGGDQAWRDLRAMLRTRIDAGLAGEVSAKSVREVLGEELTAGRRA